MSSSSSCEDDLFLCEELIVEIFSRLPTKSLVRFRSVSKSLYALIGSPGFIRLHATRSPKKLMILYQVLRCQEPRAVDDKYTLLSDAQLSDNIPPDIIFKYPFLDSIVVGSCNGILCLYHSRNGMHLWNPSIRRKVKVPSCPRKDWFPIGFGFDALTNDYKILMMKKSYNDHRRQQTRPANTFVYSIKTDSWREIASHQLSALSRQLSALPNSYMNSHHCLFNGALHWVVTEAETSTSVRSSYILTFNLSSEVFSRIELPEPTYVKNLLIIINGCLGVISKWVWVKGGQLDNSTSWSIAYKINTSVLYLAYSVCQLTVDGDLLVVPLHAANGIMVYSRETGAALRPVQVLSGCVNILHMTPCVESLELLDMGTSCG